MRDSRLGHAVHRLRGQRRKARLRSHVDDTPAILPDHHARRGLTGKERPLQIHAQRQIEVVLAHIFGWIAGRDSGVIDQNIEPSEMRGGRIHRASDLVEAGDIHL